jgi:hypothetical protein
MLHNHVVFDDPFVVGPSVEEYARSIDESELVETRRPRLLVLKRLCSICISLGARLILSAVRIAYAIQWASQPTKRQLHQVHPGVGLEFVVFGFFVVSVAMSLLV